MAKTTLILMAIIALSRAHAVPSVGIAGGYEVVPHSRPYQAAIHVPTNNGDFLCGGSLITPQTVLTAANCFKNFQTIYGEIQVVLGAHSILIVEDTQVRVNTSDYIIHPKWNRSPLNDIAVVRLPEPVTLNENIQTIALPEETNDHYMGLKVNVSGWGWVSSTAEEISSGLRAVELPITDNLSCGIPYMFDIDDTNICTSGEGRKGSCVWDNGDPSVIDDILVGVVSIKNSFLCEEGWPSAQVRVASFLDWIKQNSI